MKLFINLLITLFSVTTLITNSYSQDIIILKTGEEIFSKVEKVGTSEIEYRKIENLNGPVYTKYIDEIFMIKYENGTKDVFSLEKEKESISKIEESKIYYPVERYTNVKTNMKFKDINSNNFNFLKGEKRVNIRYVYKGMAIGDFNNGEIWVNKKTAENGTEWLSKWEADKTERYQPSFEKLLNKELKKKDISFGSYENSTYTLIVKTTFLEPGFSTYMTCKAACVSVEFTIIENKTPDKILGKIIIEQENNKSKIGSDRCARVPWATGPRIAMAYAYLGISLGRYLYYNAF